MENENKITVAPTLCADLISQNFSEILEHAFINVKSARVFRITRAYYVLIDLKAGYELEVITKERLEPFHTFLWAYICKFKSDNKAKKLFDLCDEYLANCA